MLRTRTVNMFVYIENPREHRANLLDLIKKKFRKLLDVKSMYGNGLHSSNQQQKVRKFNYKNITYKTTNILLRIKSNKYIQ